MSPKIYNLKPKGLKGCAICRFQCPLSMGPKRIMNWKDPSARESQGPYSIMEKIIPKG